MHLVYNIDHIHQLFNKPKITRLKYLSKISYDGHLLMDCDYLFVMIVYWLFVSKHSPKEELSHGCYSP